MKLTNKVYDAIRTTVGRFPAETGGILGGNEETGVITHFCFDEKGSFQSDGTTRGTYFPDIASLNRTMREVWNPAGIRLMGFVHSHPLGSPTLSSNLTVNPWAGNFTVGDGNLSDLDYANHLIGFLNNSRASGDNPMPPIERFFMPVILTEPDSGMFDIRPYAVRKVGNSVNIENTTYSLVDVDLEETYSRVVDAYSLPRMADCRVIYIGAGGASQFVEDMARAGVGEHVLIDPDTVSITNLATQQVYRRDVGRPKVDCIADRIKDINPHAAVVALPNYVEDISDEQFAALAKTALRNGRAPVQTLICGLTDNFEAQARVNRLALNLGIPSLNAQVYKEGRAAEITFTHPDTTAACSRCILSSRYNAYLRDGFKNDVTSHGTPIFATTRLNALKGFLAMGLLHYGMDDDGSVAYNRFGKMLAAIGNRNLVQIRMDADIATTLGFAIFDKVHRGSRTSRLFMDDVVWLPQREECPETGYDYCPDCGGTGRLLDAKGTFTETMTMRNSHPSTDAAVSALTPRQAVLAAA